MKLINKKELEQNQWELEISVSVEKFKEGIAQAYKKNVKKINVPGFRRGKAPQGVIEKMYGTEVFFDDAMDILIPEMYEEGVKEAKITPVSRPNIEVLKATKEEGFTFKAVVTTKPNVKVGEYKGLNVKKVIHTVTEEEVVEAVEKVQKRNGRTITVENRGAVMGDTADIDFEGFIDEVPFEGGKGEHFPLQLGSGQFIPGFEEQVVGKKAGEEFTVEVDFPKEYHADTLAGKPAKFKVKIHEIKGIELPEIDDEFVKDVSEYDTVAEYKASIKEELQKQSDETSVAQMESDMIDMIIESMTGEIPEIMFQTRVEDELRNFSQKLESQGMDLETYLQYTGTTLEGMKATFREQGEKQVKIRLALEKIVEQEKIKVTEKDIDEEIAKISGMYQVPEEEVRKLIKKEDITIDIAVAKAVELVKEKANIEEVQETGTDKTVKKAPVKKTAEKKTAEKKTTTVKATAKKTGTKKTDK